ncbi:hypothetical protein [Corticibacter populi]|uniref:hypothetical protein n=1 Tax=Corticibacter populi TaxID=1550736 RepID=UPI0011C3D4F7|nr:hypothetical protein [Corticibacter populi]
MSKPLHAAGPWIARLWILAWLALQPAHAQALFVDKATPWPDIPAPPRAHVSWVSEQMRVNGIPMRVQVFESAASLEEVVAHYRAHWKIPASRAALPSDKAYVLERDGETMIARIKEPFYDLVKVRAMQDGSSQGTMSSSLVLGSEPRLDVSSIPFPSGAEAVSVVESIDVGSRSKQVLFAASQSYARVVDYYRVNLAAAGWQPLQSQATPNAQGESAAVMLFMRDNQQLSVSAGVDGDRRLTVFNVNLVTFDQ